MKINTNGSLSLEKAAFCFVALGSEQRLSILKILVRSGPVGLTIGELGDCSGVTGSTLTHHMKILTQAGMVEQKKNGRSIICAAVSFDEIQKLSEFLLQDCCVDRKVTCDD